ncbi:hypothetical protein [Dyadobacter arcticus]|uniref:Uncharacterized protein n=1 Tax=Dyadobacter arcticus TaxID=1078754 RepID=A0ABX0UGS8_9BACT|nr:hypothetical protein [Dyadobacter arcticus]NIJ52218.1 hypothetical protein [Dyadobacter arcticus]
MRSLILLFIVFIIVDRIGLMANVAIMNPATANIPYSVGGMLEAFGFMLMLAFWYWIAIYSGWIIANLMLVFFFEHSIVRSISAGLSLPIAYLFFGTTWFLTVWHLLMGAVFGFLFHKFVNNGQ